MKGRDDEGTKRWDMAWVGAEDFARVFGGGRGRVSGSAVLWQVAGGGQG